MKIANKHVLIADLTYNLKKYLRFMAKKPKIALAMEKALDKWLESLNAQIQGSFSGHINHLVFQT